MPKKVSDTTRRRAMDLLTEGKTYREIAAICGLSLPTVGKISKQFRESLACRSCGAPIAVNSKYCSQCGQPVLSAGGALCRDLRSLSSLYRYLPDGARDRFVRAIQKTIAYIEENDHGT